MTKISITDAAKRVGIARSTMYEKYINTGKISVLSEVIDGRERKLIDLSELHRVFGDNLSLSEPDTSQTASGVRPRTPENGQENRGLQSEVEALLQRLSAAERDKEWFRHHCEELTDRLRDVQRLLEHKPAPDQAEDTAAVVAAVMERHTAEAAELTEALTRAKAEAAKVNEVEAELERARQEAVELAQKLEAERRRGFFSRLFGRDA